MKPCSTCKQVLQLSDFHKNAGHKDGYQTNCRSCVASYGKRHYRKHLDRYAERQRGFYQNNKEKIDARNRGWEMANGDKISARRKVAYPRLRNGILRRSRAYKLANMGLGGDRYQQLFDSQDGRCAICAKRFAAESNKRACIDHDHKCCPGQKSCGDCIRGILCFNCNTFLGHAKDDVQILQAAIFYLLDSPEAQPPPGIDAPTETKRGAVLSSPAAL